MTLDDVQKATLGEALDDLRDRREGVDSRVSELRAQLYDAVLEQRAVHAALENIEGLTHD